jgi:hypothetical protein
MARPRIELQAVLTALLPSGKKAYFQPAENVRMEYPCIVYKRDYADIQYANNAPYRHLKRYQVTVIDSDPDSEIPDKVKELPLTEFQRFFVANQLNHDVYNIYF